MDRVVHKTCLWAENLHSSSIKLRELYAWIYSHLQCDFYVLDILCLTFKPSVTKITYELWPMTVCEFFIMQYRSKYFSLYLTVRNCLSKQTKMVKQSTQHYV